MSEAPPDPQPKFARDMSPQQRAETLARLKLGPAPEPMDTSKKASAMLVRRLRSKKRSRNSRRASSTSKHFHSPYRPRASSSPTQSGPPRPPGANSQFCMPRK